MKFLMLMLLMLSGCAQFTQTEIDLVTQARRGIAQVNQPNDSAELMRLRRQRLDEAFDADVRAQAQLSADWVLDARKAYAAALDAYAKQQAAAEAARQTEARNLAAADAALLRLQSLLSIQQKFSIEEIGK